MIDFLKLVTEAEPTSPTPASAQSTTPGAAQAAPKPATGAAQSQTQPGTTTPEEGNKEQKPDEEKIKSIQQFFTPQVYNELKAAFENKPEYKKLELKFPTEDEFKNIVYAASNNSIRNTKDPTDFPDLAIVYPVLDLIAQIKTNLKSNQPNEVKGTFTKFLDRLKKSQGAPLDYVPVDPWALSVKQEYFTRDKAELGELALQKHNDKSIMGTILSLLSARRKQVVKKMTVKRDVSKNIDPNKIPNALNFVKDLIVHPEKYAGGNVPIPPKLAALYDVDSARELLNIGRLAKAFFVSEAGKVQPPVSDDRMNEAYEAFLNNDPQKDKNFDWSPYQQQTTQEEQPPKQSTQPQTQANGLVTQSFEYLYNSCMDILFETKRKKGNSKQRKQARKAAERAAKEAAEQENSKQTEEPKPQPTEFPAGAPPLPPDSKNQETSTEEVPEPSAQQQPSAETPEEESPEQAQPPAEKVAQIKEGGYTLGNIKELKQNTQGQALYNALKKFADYIRAGIERDYTGAISSAAGALKSLSKIGGPTMGK